MPLGCMQFMYTASTGMMFPTAFAFINRALDALGSSATPMMGSQRVFFLRRKVMEREVFVFCFSLLPRRRLASEQCSKPAVDFRGYISQ